MDVIPYTAENREAVPVLAVVIHQRADEYVAVKHDVLPAPDGSAPILSAGELLTRETLRTINDQLTGASKMRAVLPGNVLVSDIDIIAWWQPAQRRPIFFRTASSPELNELNGKSVFYPPLLFVGKSESLSVFALDLSLRPEAHTPLFRAPFFNVYASGHMCEGDAPLPKQPHPDEECLRLYERAFYDSDFTHTNLGEKIITTYPGGHTALWQDMLTKRKFPISALKPLTERGNPLTVERIINETPANRILIDA